MHTDSKQTRVAHASKYWRNQNETSPVLEENNLVIMIIYTTNNAFFQHDRALPRRRRNSAHATTPMRSKVIQLAIVCMNRQELKIQAPSHLSHERSPGIIVLLAKILQSN